MLLEIGVAIINTLVRRLSGGSNFSIKVDFWASVLVSETCNQKPSNHTCNHDTIPQLLWSTQKIEKGWNLDLEHNKC